MSLKRINEFPEGSGTLTNDDVLLFMDDPSGGGGTTKKISLGAISSILGTNSQSITVSDISDFNSGVSGLLPVTDIVAGSGISIAKTSSVFTINSKLRSDPSGIQGASAINNIVQISQGDYNSITPDPDTLYIIT